jgi:hypothetical protein
LLQQPVEDHAVQVVDLRPAELARAHAGHRGLIARAPRIGERRPVDAQPLAPAELLSFADDRRAPVDDGAEHIEDERLHGGLSCAHGYQYLRKGPV